MSAHCAPSYILWRGLLVTGLVFAMRGPRTFPARTTDPRLEDGARVSRRIAQAVAATLLAALLISAVAPAAAAPAAGSRRVVVLFAPYMTWSDLSGGFMPHARALADKSLLGDMNIRAGASGGLNPPDRGALVLSAGASVVFAPEALTAFDTSETVGPTLARDYYRRLFGTDPGASQVVYLGLPLQVSTNVPTTLDNEIGALGAAVHAKGLKTAAIGNGDPGWLVDPSRTSRPAGVTAADEKGVVDRGDVSVSMLVRDSFAPFGTRADVARITAEYRSVLADPSVGLVFVDPGDLERAAAAASITSSSAAAAAHNAALRSTDDVLGHVIDSLGPDDVVVLMATSPIDVLDQPEGFAPLMIAGPEGNGIATAASTHRDGIVTAMDVSVTLVDLLGGTPPEKMVGSLIHAGKTLAGAPLAARTAFLDQLNATCIAVEAVRWPTVTTYIVFAALAIIISTLILFRGVEALPAATTAVTKAALLLVPAVLVGSVVQFAVWRWPPTVSAVIGTFLVCTTVIWIAVLVLARRRPPAVPLIILTAVTAVVLMVDQWVGAPLSFIGLFGYSPLLGARYYGLGNEMSGLLLGCVLVAVALALDTWRDRRWAWHVRTWGWPAIGLVVLATAAAPFWGANVGPVAWMTVGFLVGWLMLNGRKIWTWRNLLLVVVLVVVMLAGLTAVDLLGGSGSETHLGRAVAGTQTGGLASLWAIVARKAETNARVLGRTNWTWLLVVMLVQLGYMRWRPRGEFAAMLREYPAFSAAVAAALFAGVAGYFTEDSGIIIPALLLIPVGVSALYLMLGRVAPSGGDGS